MTDDYVTIRIPVSRQLLRDLLCTAVEGGSNYWADFDQRKRTDNLDYLSIRVTEHETHSEQQTTPYRRTVKAEHLAIGLQRLATAAAEHEADPLKGFATAAQHLADALQNHDTGTADVVLQMTVFGELIYG